MGQKDQKTSSWAVLKNYARATLEHPRLFAASLFAVLLAVVSELAIPLFLREFVDLISNVSRRPEVLGAGLGILALYAVAVSLNWLAYRLQMMSVTRLEAKVQSSLLNRAFDYLIGHSNDFFISNFTGTLTGRISRYSAAYQQVFGSIVENMLHTGLFSLGVTIVLFTKNVWLGTGLLLWTIFFLGLQYVLTKWRYQFKILRAAEDSRMTGAISDAVGNHSAIALFANEKSEGAYFRNIVRSWRHATIRAWNSDILNYAIQGFLTRSAQVALLIGGFYLWYRGVISLGDLVLIQAYLLTLMDQVSNIGSNMRQLYDAFADAKEMIDILETPHAVQDAPGARALVISDGAISFIDAGFRYDEMQPVFADFSLAIRGGEKVALVGPSGAGKSTITKLLLRLNEVTEGKITIDGQDIREVTQESLRRAIGFVPQEPALFHRTLRENIAYGKQDASEEEIVAAAKKAHCHEFISKLPLGYDTYVGERGVKLSGGERQRVAIARAILKDAPILVLDEATSSLDSESEHFIQDALKTLMEGKTVIVIAHRLSTIMTMDRIVVIEDGKIAAEGTHDELLDDHSGLYHKLWSIQAGSFLADRQ